MGHEITIQEKCDRCKSGFNSRQIDLETAIRMKELEEAGTSEAIFSIRLIDQHENGEPKIRERVYNRLCSGCRRVLGNLIDSADPVTRRPRGPAKKPANGESASAQKPPKQKGKGGGKSAESTKTA